MKDLYDQIKKECVLVGYASFYTNGDAVGFNKVSLFCGKDKEKIINNIKSKIKELDSFPSEKDFEMVKDKIKSEGKENIESTSSAYNILIRDFIIDKLDKLTPRLIGDEGVDLDRIEIINITKSYPDTMIKELQIMSKIPDVFYIMDTDINDLVDVFKDSI